jgi:hypothetical protein
VEKTASPISETLNTKKENSGQELIEILHGISKKRRRKTTQLQCASRFHSTLL